MPIHVEYATFALLMAANLGIGLYFSLVKRARLASTPDEVFLGGRTLKMLPLAVSVLASMISAIGVIGFSAHYYAYGFHYSWSLLASPLLIPVVAGVIIPVLYRLRVTSVFQYLRMRYGNKVGLAACAIYLFLSQTIGAVALFSASLATATVFHVPLIWTTMAIGLAGTVYTALGGLRGVVWTDCVQAVLILMAPVTVIAKVILDSSHKDVQLRPLSDFDIKEFAFRMNLDFTSDENFWSCFLGLYVHNLFRAGMDQTVVQRYLASRTLRDAQRIMVIGIALNVFYMIVIGFMALALIYWYRDCDPMLSGAIKKFDQILPYYVKQNLMDLPGFSGLFLTGVVSAATSTISSIINSQAAVCYVDVVSQYKKLSDSHVTLLTKGLAFLFGFVMTLYAVVVPYLGSAVRIIMVVHNGASGPFVGMFLLALAFPWTNGKGVVIATILTTAVQFWQMFGKLAYNVHAPRMKVTLDYCPNNLTYVSKQIQNSTLFVGSLPRRDIFPLYRMSSNWSVLATTAFTVLLGMLISLLTGGAKTWKHNIHLTSHTFLRLWSKLNLLPCDIEKQSMEEPLDEGSMRRKIVLDQPLLGKDAVV
ncbi:unnamed protein product [Ixodes persulcatus]